MKNKQQLFVIIAILLIIAGSLLFVKEGVLRIIDNSTEAEMFQCGEYWRCLEYDTSYDLKKNGTTIANVVIVTNFRTDGEFAVDNRIDYIMEVKINNPDIVYGMEAMIARPFENVTEIMTNNEFLDFRKNAQEHRQWIFLDKESTTHYTDKDFFTYPREDEIVFVMFVIDYEGKVHPIHPDMEMLDVKPHTDYMVAKQVLELEYYNSKILGLGYMGISIPFILIGADMLLRIYLRESIMEK